MRRLSAPVTIWISAKGAEKVKGVMKETRFTTGGGGVNYFREGYEEKCVTCFTGLGL